MLTLEVKFKQNINRILDMQPEEFGEGEPSDIIEGSVCDKKR